ncbi:MAG: helix-turn-helix transcriptional regulator [Clostridia bacterium]|nr:helix-turn-helix transcriptional regulator [Clostridia bacterium]
MKIKAEKKRSEILLQYRRYLKYMLHSQPDVEIVYVLKGSFTVRIDENEYTVGAGDLLTVFPNQIHEYIEDSPDLEAYLLIASPENLCGSETDEFDRLPNEQIFRAIGENHLIARCFKEIFGAYSGESPHREMIVGGLLAVMAGELLDMLDFSMQRIPREDIAHRVLRYCSEHFREPLTLERLEGELFVSRSYLSHVFSDRLGTGFCQYINSLRVSEACRLLKSRDEITMTEISESVGFGSIRSFNRAFRQITGVSPAEYRRLRRKKK